MALFFLFRARFTQPPDRCARFPHRRANSCSRRNRSGRRRRGPLAAYTVSPPRAAFLRYPPPEADYKEARRADWTDSADPPRRVPDPDTVHCCWRTSDGGGAGPDTGWRKGRTGVSGGWWTGTWRAGLGRRAGGCSAAAARTWGPTRAAPSPHPRRNAAQPSAHQV